MAMKKWMGAAIAAVVAPNAALAGIVSIEPLATPAPTLSGMGLIGSAVLLASFGVVILRRRSIRLVTTIVITLLLSEISHAGFQIFPIIGDDCNRLTTKQYPTNEFLQLKSFCSNQIRIVALDPQCMGSLEGRAMADVGLCQVGDVIQPSEGCFLPNCL